ncbi:hypothetical protein A8L35_03780 [Yersinia enterocolitica subsp. palearctica]|nr:hypothetical protein IOK_18463 [Yersinia enterocolitica subsp. palearctica PhRBD_Ye1]OAM69526.1 hypothetical protein A8L35_03780 [Yersinia enterocolitica subsp. palearctica]
MLARRVSLKDELTQVSDSGDKSARSRFERCWQRPRRGEAHERAESRTQPTHMQLEVGRVYLINAANLSDRFPQRGFSAKVNGEIGIFYECLKIQRLAVINL